MSENIIFAFALTLFAGLATGIGSLIALVAKTTNRKFLSYSLGLSAGVMIYISFVEIFPTATEYISSSVGDGMGEFVTALCFFGGIGIIALIDKFVPAEENPHEMHSLEEMSKPSKDSRLKRVGFVTAIAIGVHNFPEGIATFMASIESPSLGIPIAAAIAIHNIPEGIAVSVPIYHATGDKRKAFRLSFLSGLSEPIGALVAFFILKPFFSPLVLGSVFAAVAGIMVYISLDELLPAAREYGEHHISIYGVVSGMAIMALSLTIL